MPWRPKKGTRPSATTEETPIKSSGAVEYMGIPPIQSSAWTSDKQLSLLTLIGLTIGTGYLTYRIFRPFLASLFIAIILAITSAPLHRWVGLPEDSQSHSRCAYYDSADHRCCVDTDYGG